MIKIIKLDTTSKKNDAIFSWDNIAAIVDCVAGGIVAYVTTYQEPYELAQVLNRNEPDPRTEAQKDTDESSRFYVQDSFDATNEEQFKQSIVKGELVAIVDTERFVVLAYTFEAADRATMFRKTLLNLSE